MNDRTSLALAETLREHDRDVTRDLPAAPLIAGARRRRTRRRVTMSAAALAAAGLVFGIAVSTIPGRDASMPIPAGTGTPGHVQVRETSAVEPDSPPTTVVRSSSIEEWASALPVGAPFEPYEAFSLLEDRNGVPVYRDKAGDLSLGQEAFEVRRSLRAGTLGDQPSSTIIVVGEYSSGRGVVWAVSPEAHSAKQLWRGPSVIDILGGQHSVALIAGEPGAEPPTLELVELADGATASRMLSLDSPKQPRLATWKNGEITVIDGQAAKGQDGASSPVRESAAYTWSEGDGWVAGAVRRWFGPARTGFEQHDLGRNIVMIGTGDEVCAHLMDGPDLAAEPLTCAPDLSAEQAPMGSLVLLSRDLGEGRGFVPVVVDLADGSLRDLPVTEPMSPLRWESNLTLAGQVPDESRQGSVAFRIDLGKSARHERLPEPLPQG